MKKILPYVGAVAINLATVFGSNSYAVEPEKVKEVAKYIGNNPHEVDIYLDENSMYSKRWFYIKDGEQIPYINLGAEDTKGVYTVYVQIEEINGKATIGLSKFPYKKQYTGEKTTIIDKGLDGKIDEVIKFKVLDDKLAGITPVDNPEESSKYQKEFDEVIDFLYSKIQKNTLK